MMNKFQNNDLPKNVLRRHIHNFHRKQTNQQRNMLTNNNLSSIVFKVPFIRDKFNHQLSCLMKKSCLDVLNATQPAIPLNRILNKIHRFQKCNKPSCPIRDPIICTVTNVVDNASYTLWSSFYIGSTPLSLHERFMQHLQTSRKTAMYQRAKDHYREP